MLLEVSFLKRPRVLVLELVLFYPIFGDWWIFLLFFVNLKYYCLETYAIYDCVSTHRDYLYLDIIDFVFLFKRIHYGKKDCGGYVDLYRGRFSCDLEAEKRTYILKCAFFFKSSFLKLCLYIFRFMMK